MFVIDKLLQQKRLSIALGSAAAAGLLGWLFLQHLETTYQDNADRVPILIAARYIPSDTPLRARFFKRVFIPKTYAAPSAITAFEVLESSGHPLWRSRIVIPEGVALTPPILRPIHESDTLSQHIGENEVAVSFGIEPVRAVAGSLQPGDVIDILHTPKPKELDSTFRATALLFQSVRIAAVGTRWSRDKETATDKEPDSDLILTVVMNPLAALRLSEARENELLSVMLHAPDDLPTERVP